MAIREVQKVVIVGAGTMGSSIALAFAMAGIRVELVDLKEEVLVRAQILAKSGLNTLVEYGKVSAGQVPTILDRIRTSTDLEASARDADFAIEAVYENEDVKTKILAELERVLPTDAIIASNTSGLDIFSLYDMKNPERLVIAHWFAPAHIIPLVEVVPGPETSPECLNFTAELMEKIGKKPLVMKAFVRSFIVNRIQNHLTMACFELLQNGWATPQDIDFAIKTTLGIRLPIVGAMQNLDFTGLDLVQALMKSNFVRSDFIDGKVENGQLGAKSSSGIYDYNGRSEEEILNQRDKLYLKMVDQLESTTAFEPI